MHDPIIDVKNLTKIYKVRRRSDLSLVKRFFSRTNYDEVHALSDISFRIEKGEYVGLIGNNGAGKSTLIKLLTGILSRTDGSMNVLGSDPFENRVKNNFKIGAVFGQRTQLNWDLSTMDSLELLKQIYNIPSVVYKNNIEMFVELFGMEKIVRQPVRTLSLGQRMQCEIMASFLHNPELVFLDEPTIGLDVFSKDIITNFLKVLKSNLNTTLMFTSHDLEEMSKICDRAMVLYEGKILIEEKVETLLSFSNQQKRVIFTFELEKPDFVFNVSSGNIMFEPYKMICEGVKKDEVGSLISKVANTCFVTDMRIEESNFTDIIRSRIRGA